MHRQGAVIAVVCCTSAWAQGVITSFAGADHTFADNGQPAKAARLIGRSAVAFDGSRNLFIVSPDLNMVFEVGPDGLLNIVAGNGQNGFSGDDGPAVAASLSAPNGLAIDANGNLYIADTGNNRVRMVTPDGNITTVAGTGQTGFFGDGDAATKAFMNGPGRSQSIRKGTSTSSKSSINGSVWSIRAARLRPSRAAAPVVPRRAVAPPSAMEVRA